MNFRLPSLHGLLRLILADCKSTAFQIFLHQVKKDEVQGTLYFLAERVDGRRVSAQRPVNDPVLNVFWQTSGAVTVGANAHFEGVVLSQTAINFGNQASANSRLLAQTAVNLNQNAITPPAQ